MFSLLLHMLTSLQTQSLFVLSLLGKKYPIARWLLDFDDLKDLSRVRFLGKPLKIQGCLMDNFNITSMFSSVCLVLLVLMKSDSGKI